MVRRFRLIPLAVSMYVMGIVIYMIRPIGADIGVHKSFWICFYWSLNKFLTLVGLGCARVPNRDEVDNLFTDFAIIQTISFILYYIIGSVCLQPEQMNDTTVTVALMMMAGLLALIIMWKALREKTV